MSWAAGTGTWSWRCFAPAVLALACPVAVACVDKAPTALWPEPPPPTLATPIGQELPSAEPSSVEVPQETSGETSSSEALDDFVEGEGPADDVKDASRGESAPESTGATKP